MTGGRWIWDAGEGRLIPAAEFHVKHASRARSALPTPMLIPDHMDPVQSMLDGKLYDSKAALRATYRAAGVEEVGNDSSVMAPKPYKKPRPDRKEIRAAVRKAASLKGLGA
jgi:hypothetical protein